ncbi:hypothetical protein DL89DRAFT_268988 [Linderina pennispora]|uniref:Uncharacterized protein n=1 Tax=Linderina pennispora TaxID=61395 RepID=A0A1Y1W2K7_9FUNG|nr:uncharacterized protein DL89DRAFT_268988 [Linderina pennispora]ORX67783.1 hypothetical protein DL89DRAFT_268988 [Linderina pennispora]
MASTTIDPLSHTSFSSLRADSSPVKSNGVDIHQMDLLSGTVALLGVASIILQAIRTPLKFSYPHFAVFLKWLEASIEKDLDVFLNSCTKDCDTRCYQLTRNALLRRLSSNIFVEGTPGCNGGKSVTADDLKETIKEGGGDALIELARIGGYPRMKALRRAVYLTRHAPKQLETIVVWQWIGVVVHWLIFDLTTLLIPAVLSATYWVGRVFRGGAHKMRPQMACTPFISKRLISYDMLELAKHRIQIQHQPWVRFGTYFMLAELSEKPISVRAWGKDDRQDTCDHLVHPLVYDRRICSQISTDQCSVARMLYTVSLLSIRTMLLCSNIAFVPNYVILSGHSNLDLKRMGPMLLVNNGTLHGLYELMYQVGSQGNGDLDKHARERLLGSYRQLTERMRGKLGDMICEGSQTSILLNLALASMQDNSVNEARDLVAQMPGTQNPANQFELAGVKIDPESFLSVYQHRLVMNTTIGLLIESVQTFDLHWGATTWLLQLFLRAYEDVNLTDDHSTCSSETANPGKIRGRVKALCFLPFQPKLPHPPAGADERQRDMPMASKLKDKGFQSIFRSAWSPFGCNEAGQLLSAPPAWCVCRRHCTGLCTLVVERWKLLVSAPLYQHTPYIFDRRTEPGTESSPLLPDSIIPIVPLICSTNIRLLNRHIKKMGWIGKTTAEAGDNGIPTSSTPEQTSNAITALPPGPLTDHLYQKLYRILVISRGRIYTWDLDKTSNVVTESVSYFCKPETVSVSGTLLTVYEADAQAIKGTETVAVNTAGHTGDHQQPPELSLSPIAWRYDSHNSPCLSEEQLATH